MNEVSYVSIREALGDLTEGELLDAVVVDAINYGRKHAGQIEWQIVDTKVRAKTRKAPLPPFKHRIAELARADDELFVPLLVLWARAQGDLEERVRDLLAGQGLHGLLSETPDDLKREDIDAAVSEASEELCKELPECKSADVPLMVFRVLYIFEDEPEEPAVEERDIAAELQVPPGIAVDSASQPRSATAGKSPDKGTSRRRNAKASTAAQNTDAGVVLGGLGSGVFGVVLGSLHAMPASDSQWDLAEELVDAIRKVVEDKRAEATVLSEIADSVQKRADLAHALDAIRDDYSGEIAEVGVDVIDSRRSECSDEGLESARSAADDLRVHLDLYREKKTERPAGREALKGHWTALSELTDAIAARAEALGAVLGQPMAGDLDQAVDTEEDVAEALETQADGDDEPSSPGVLEDFAPDQKSETSEDPCRVDSSEPVAAEDEQLAVTMPDETPAPPLVSAAHEQTDAERAWEQFLWSLIADDDVPAAYWVAESLEHQGRRPAVPAWLLEAVQGASWLGVDSEFQESLRVLAEKHLPEAAGAEGMLALAASLRPVLAAPQTGLLGWLQNCGSAASALGLQDLLSAVRHYAEHSGIGLRPEDLKGVEGQQERQRVIVEAAHEAAGWLESAPGMHSKYQRASAVWHALVSASGELHGMLQVAARDERRKVADAKQQAMRLRDPECVQDMLHDVQARLYAGKRPPDIVAAAADWLSRRLDESCRVVLRWADLVEREAQVHQRGDWYFKEVKELRASAAKCFPVVQSALLEHCSDTSSWEMQAVAKCVLRAVTQLADTLRLDNTDPQGKLAVFLRDSGPPADWWSEGKHGLRQALAARLLWVPGASLGNDGIPDPESVPDLASLIRAAVGAGITLEDAVDDRIVQQQDFRFAERMLEGLQTNEDVAAIRKRVREKIETARTKLHREIREAQRLVERGVVDGVIADDERARYSAAIEQAAASDIDRGSDEGSVATGRQIAELESIQTEVSNRRKQRLEEQRDIWRDQQAELARRYPSDVVAPVVKVVDEALETDDLVVVGECLATVREILAHRDELDLNRFTSPSLAETLETFLTDADEIKSAAPGSSGLRPVAAAVKGGKAIAGFDYGRLNVPRRSEVLDVLQAWQTLKKQRGSSEQTSAALPIILKYLGFDLRHKEGTGRAVVAEKSTADWAHYRVTMSAGRNARPIPQYGSSSHGTYDVVCFWGRPGMDQICSGLEQIKSIQHGRAIVVYLGHMTEPQRRELVAATRQGRLEPLLLDETLLLFLTRCFDVRLGDFLRCTLPFATLNPYTPFVAGDVPPEMYFGRDDMAKEIESIEGSSLVYGGRQLGKSALLRHVQRRFHNPELGQYAVVEPIQHIGEADTPARDIWKKLHRALKEIGLISGSFTSGDKLQDRIVQALAADEKRRVIVMFDEADKFLDDDSQSNFPVVGAMKSVMQATDRRFKMVFAGLHQVQRFQGIPNQPLAHLGRPIRVGPLDPLPARQLILEPLAAMGYRLENEAVLRILSYTNYHPGLIQLFCKSLLDLLHGRRETSPPWQVDRKLIETVYYQDLREGIRERFDWTLALDPRYQAIAWSMIVDQMEDQDGYARLYTPGRVLRLARSWWPVGFRDLASDEMRGLLNEMEGLGVLVQSADTLGAQSYCLRSPNLVRLMGTDEDVENRLLELSDTDPDERDFQAQMHRRWIDDAGWSPLTRAQEQTLTQARPGFSMVFASEALGSERLAQMASSLLPGDLAKDAGQAGQMKDEIRSAEAASKWLTRFRDQHREADRLIVYKQLAGLRPAEVEGVIVGCRDFCAKEAHAAAQRAISVTLLLPPEAAWAWLSAKSDVKYSTEARADAIAWARPLGSAGLEQWLASADAISTADAVQEVLGATGGWPTLLDWLRDQARGNDLRAAIPALQAELDNASSPLRAAFVNRLGLAVCPQARTALNLIKELQPANESDLPEWLETELDMAASEGSAVVDFLQRMGSLHTNDNGELVVDRIVDVTTG